MSAPISIVRVLQLALVVRSHCCPTLVGGAFERVSSSEPIIRVLYFTLFQFFVFYRGVFLNICTALLGLLTIYIRLELRCHDGTLCVIFRVSRVPLHLRAWTWYLKELDSFRVCGETTEGIRSVIRP